MKDWAVVSGSQRDSLGEGVLWSERDNAVYWVDILAPAVYRLSLGDMSTQCWAMPEPIGWIIERSSGGFIAGLQSGFAEVSLDPFKIAPIGDPEPHYPQNRMNDGAVDSEGAIWCGTMDNTESAATGSLYKLSPNRTWQPMDSDYHVPNGPAFSACGRYFYHSDTALRTVFRFTRTKAGGIAQREPFITFAESDGYPDGMTVDAAGGLWIAHWGGARVSRFHADGTLDRSIVLPCRQPTNVTFAGAGLTRMFVTSATKGLDAHECDGALFELSDVGIGLRTHLYRG